MANEYKKAFNVEKPTNRSVKRFSFASDRSVRVWARAALGEEKVFCFKTESVYITFFLLKKMSKFCSNQIVF